MIIKMRKAQITDKTSKIKGILRISNKKIPLGHKKKNNCNVQVNGTALGSGGTRGEAVLFKPL